MGALQRLSRVLKALTITRLPDKPSAWGLLPRTGFDYETYAGDGRQSSIVMACVGWVQDTFPEAPTILETLNQDGEFERVESHEFLTLLDTPNDFYDGFLLQAALTADLLLSGNAYLLKLRSAAGRTVQLYWAPSGMLDPKWPKESNVFISHYEYRPGGTTPLRLEVDDVIHFRLGLDPKNSRKGLSPLGSLFREMFTDHEAANMTAALLKNLGVPGLLISPKTDTGVTTENLKEVREFLKERFSGDFRGEPLATGMPTEVQMFGFNPQQMDLRNLRYVPEERICAVLRVPAMVAGMGAGLNRSTFANYAEAREAAYESRIIPLQRLVASVLKRQLLRDYEDDLERWRVGYDLSQVRVLQEDETQRVDRLSKMVAGGFLKVKDAQRLAGMPVDDTQDFYLRPITALEVPSAPAREPLEVPEPMKMRIGLESKNGDDPRTLQRLDIFLKRHDPHERRFTTWLQGEFKRQEKETLAKLGVKKQGLGEIFSLEITAQTMAKGALPYILAMLQVSGEDAATEVGSVFNISNPHVTQWLGEKTKAFGKNVSETTAKAITEVLQDAHAQGLSIPEISKGIQEVFNEASETRASTIARTEMTAASNEGAVEAWKESGVVKGKEWLATFDERVRPDHLAAHGQVVGLERPFRVGGEDIMVPGEGSPGQAINCRCAVAPVLLNEPKMAPETRCPSCGRFLGLALKGDIFCPRCNQIVKV